MNRKIAIGLLLIWAFTSFNMTLSTYAGSVDSEIIIYCAPYGNDNAKGTIDAPLKTLKGAKNKVDMLKLQNKPVTVYFRGGEYKVDETTIFFANDSGTKSAPITYAAYGDEEPIFTGAKKIPVENFKPLSDEEASRVPDGAAKYIGVADLKKIGITRITDFEGFSGTEYIDSVANTTINILYNGKEQTLASWPNGVNHYTHITTKKSASEFMIEDEERMANWLTAENPMVYGWMAKGFSFQRVPVKEFKLETKMVTTKFPVPRGVVEEGEVRVVNLLEELDVPGEYYVNPRTLKVYFYPPYVDTNANIEIISNETNLVNLRNASNIIFKNLNFCNNRADAFELTNCDNIQFLGCRFRNIELMAIDTMYCTNTLVDGCDFVNIGSTGVRFDERNDGREDVSIDVSSVRTDLTPDNNIVNNCYFWDVATQSLIYTGAIRIHGVGNKATHNAIHESRSSFIHHGGNDIQLNYNEIWNGLKHSRDMGMVYNGRNVVQRGNETAYNYFHDWHSTNPHFGKAIAIYDDDSLTGNNKHHNFFVNGESAAFQNGTNWGKFDKNIIAQCEDFGYFYTYGWHDRLDSTQFFVKNQVSKVYTLDEYDRYDNVKEMFFQYPYPPKEVSTSFNLFYKPSEKFFSDWMPEAYRSDYTIEDNITDEEGEYYEYFNDPENGDFTIKTDIKVPDELKEWQGITLDDIGIYESDTRKQTVYKLGEFSINYPCNYASDIDSKSAYFSWEKSENADEYIIEIATDPEFKNIVHKDICPYNYAYYTDLDSAKTVYYWRVSAVCNMMNNREILPSKSGTMVLRTKMYDKLYLKPLKLEVAEAVEQVEGMTEGNGSCQVKPGTKKEINNLIKKANVLLKKEYGDQLVIDDMVSTLKKSVEDAYFEVPIYYNDSSDLFTDDLKGWIEGETANVVRGDNEVGVFSTTSSVNATTAFTGKFMPTNSIMSIKIKPTLPEDAPGGMWQAIAFADMDYVGQRFWAMQGASGLLIVIKSNSIELQIRDGVNPAIVLSSDKAMKQNEWNDVEVGIMDYGKTQRCILRINGDDVIDYASKDMRIEKKLYFALYDTGVGSNATYRTHGIFAKAGQIPEGASIISEE